MSDVEGFGVLASTGRYCANNTYTVMLYVFDIANVTLAHSACASASEGRDGNQPGSLRSPRGLCAGLAWNRREIAGGLENEPRPKGDARGRSPVIQFA